MRLLPGVARELGLEEASPTARARAWSASIRYARTLSEAEAVLRVLADAPPAALAVDTEYAFDRPPVTLRSGEEWFDIRSIRPICMSLATADTVAVIDLRAPGVSAVVAAILALPSRLVFHHVKSELFVFWRLGLDANLVGFYDTQLAEACLRLGEFHVRRGDGEHHEQERRRRHALSLVGQCARYGLGYPYSDGKEELRREFATLVGDGPLTVRLLEYAAADAAWTLRLFRAQAAAVAAEGLGWHLEAVEFPFAVANARIEWNGVHVGRDRLQLLRDVAARAAETNRRILAAAGVDPPSDPVALRRVLAMAGVDGLFVRDGEFSTSEGRFKDLEHVHPAVRPFRLHRRYTRLRAEEWTAGRLTGADGRLHPRHVQLGAATGRNTCTTPNLPGIGRALRPVVTAPPGRALFELDYSQIEVGVAAAEHRDEALIAAFNSGDVYVEAARRFFADTLTDEERAFPAVEFKLRFGHLRDAMKVFVLSVVNNMKAGSLARRFELSPTEAETQRRRFLDLYPRLRDGLAASARNGLRKGYAEIVGGLRRRTCGARGAWVENFLRNTPLQGGAAVVFKRAVVALDRAFSGTTTRIVLPIHDAVLIECDEGAVEQIAEEASDLMRKAMSAVYPALQGRVELNAKDVSCWNKDGDAKSFERFADLDDAPPPEVSRWPDDVRAVYERRRADLSAAGDLEPARRAFGELREAAFDALVSRSVADALGFDPKAFSLFSEHVIGRAGPTSRAADMTLTIALLREGRRS